MADDPNPGPGHARGDTGASAAAGAPPQGEGWLRVLWIGIVLVYIAVLAASWPLAGRDDYDQFLVFHELQYWNASLFGMAKQWTPVMCGGLSMAGEPQVPFLSLSMLLTYAIGPLHGPRLAAIIYLVIGWTGMNLYAGIWLERRLTRALAASLFIGNGFFLARFCHGHVDLIPFLVLPAVLWLLHQTIAWDRQRMGAPGVSRPLLAVLLLGALVGLVVDGAPVAFVHLLVWIALYALVLAANARSVAPLIVLGGALVVTAVLDAGYVWPMLVAQQEFPRLTPDAFTNPLTLVWFMLLPVRGKLIPAPANGHELSVFIGPVIAFAIWRYRKTLCRELPKELRVPLLVVSVVVIVLGMGSLRPLHVPVWLSPFDWLRPLPGFRSMGVTGRFWGFLALPLSLLGAAALVRFAAGELTTPRRARTWLVVALVLQLGFQMESVAHLLIRSRQYWPVPFQEAFKNGAELIDYIDTGPRDQGEVLTPTTGVIDCYNQDDFIRPAMEDGTRLVREARILAPEAGGPVACRGEFASWSRIRITAVGPPARAGSERGRAIAEIVLNQAYHPLWAVGDGASLSMSEQGNLTVRCSLQRLEQAPLDLEFRDPVSDAGAGVSSVAWAIWAALVAGLGLVPWATGRRTVV